VKNLNFFDVLAILFSWAGAAAVAYFVKDALVAIICIAAAYYLAKWVILKGQSEPENKSE